MKNHILATGPARSAAFFKNIGGILKYSWLAARIYWRKINTRASILMNAGWLRPPILSSAPEAGSGELPFNEGKIPANSAPLASAKDAYRKLCEKETSIPIFSRDWWLDATVGPEAWDVAIVKKNAQIVAAMPYVSRRRYWLRVISQPALTPALGPWIRSGDGKPATKLSNEKELMQALIDQLPYFDYFSQTWDCSRTNWQPFFWNGFQQTTKYTYVLTKLGETEKLWSGFDHRAREEIKKASNRFKLRVRDDLPLDDLLALSRMTFQRQGMSPPYSDAFVRRLDAACAERACRKFFIAVDPAGQPHAGGYMVWDENSAYTLFSGANPSLRNSGATSLCRWESIKHAANVTQQFNFTGSMIEAVEQAVRNFGGTQVPYFHISKTPSRLLRMRQGLLSVIRGK